MITYALVTAGLLGIAGACQPAGALPDRQAQKETVIINFEWRLTEKWQVEIREYQFRPGMPPKLVHFPWNIELREIHEHRGAPPGQAGEVIRIDEIVDVTLPQGEVIETQYSPDLRTLFQKAKNQRR